MNIKKGFLMWILGIVLFGIILFLFFNQEFTGRVVDLSLSKYDCDINQDGTISLDDFKILNLNHDKVGCKSSDWCSGSDINKDSVVDIRDFEILSEAYVNQKSLSELEEPSKNVFCEEWSECEVVYGLDELIEGRVFLEGEQFRMCGDKIERKVCDSRIPITIKKVNRCSKEYVEVYDLEESLISRLELIDGNYKMLNIELSAEEGDDCF